MIEIRTGPDAPAAHTDGGHHPEQTRAIAHGIREAARLLNYATSPESSGLGYPSDVYDVLGTLSSAVALLPQALGQMSEWIRTEVDAGHAQENADYGRYGGDADAAARALASVTTEARAAAEHLQRLLSEGQSTMRGMESIRADGDDDE